MISKKGKQILPLLISMLFIILMFYPAYADDTNQSSGGTVSVYKWELIKNNNALWDTDDYVCFSNFNHYSGEAMPTSQFKAHYYKRKSSSSDNIADLYCECNNPSSVIEPGSSVTLRFSMWADVTLIKDNKLFLAGKVFIATPDLELSALSSNAENAIFFKTQDSKGSFKISSIDGLERQDYLITGIMPDSKKAGDRISIYFWTSAGYKESQYELRESKIVVPGSVSTPTTTTTTAASTTGGTSASTSAASQTPATQKANTMTVKAKKVTASLKTLKKKNVTIKAKNAFTVKKAIGKVTYKKTAGSKKITVSKAGKITVKKKTKKGKYTIKVKVTAAGNKSYKAKSKTVKLTITVK